MGGRERKKEKMRQRTGSARDGQETGRVEVLVVEVVVIVVVIL